MRYWPTFKAFIVLNMAHARQFDRKSTAALRSCTARAVLRRSELAASRKATAYRDAFKREPLSHLEADELPNNSVIYRAWQPSGDANAKAAGGQWLRSHTTRPSKRPVRVALADA
jgi:hypothetical protein